MLACITEIESPAWRAGMIEGLTRCHALAASEGLRGPDLLRTVVRRFNALTPLAYHAYCTAYLHQGCLYGVMPKMLSFWQWRYLASDLAEIAQVTALLGCASGLQEEEARAALLLDDAVPGNAPYQSVPPAPPPITWTAWSTPTASAGNFSTIASSTATYSSPKSWSTSTFSGRTTTNSIAPAAVTTTALRPSSCVPLSGTAALSRARRLSTASGAPWSASSPPRSNAAPPPVPCSAASGWI
jgi:hypothetical protein